MSQKRTLHQPKDDSPVHSVVATVVRGKAQPQSASGEDTLTIGSAEDNPVVIEDPAVSRYHVELSPTEGGVLVRDLDSLNGTYLGAVRVYRAVVPLGSEIILGSTRIKVTSKEAKRKEAAPVTLPGVVFESQAMHKVAQAVAQIAPSDVSVLLQGETGTGKEVIARSLHDLSPRNKAPFVVVDCGSMPATLIASELFGHERGAFTGAERRHDGAFKRADGGTLFLDEIGELPLPVQPVLLGALARRSFRRVGGRDEVEVNVRVIAATHRDLRAAVNKERFRSDLYFRLAVARIVLPPLRERAEDIDCLLKQFVMEATGQAELPFGPDTMAALKAHRWSGNVRELRNVVEAALAMGEVKLERTRSGADTQHGEAENPELPIVPYRDARAGALLEFEATYLARLIGKTSGNASEAARIARMDRQYLLGLLRKHDLR